MAATPRAARGLTARFTTSSWCTAGSRVPGYENLKASALVESPVPFRSRNVFVFANFLDRV